MLDEATLGLALGGDDGACERADREAVPVARVEQGAGDDGRVERLRRRELGGAVGFDLDGAQLRTKGESGLAARGAAAQQEDEDAQDRATASPDHAKP